MTSDRSLDEGGRPTTSPPWAWCLALLVALGIGIGIGLSLRPTRVERPTGRNAPQQATNTEGEGTQDTLHEARAILEMAAVDPGGAGTPDAEKEVPAIRVEMLSRERLRAIVVSRKVDFGVEVDPEDETQVDRLCRQVAEGTRIQAISSRHIAVAHRGPEPERSAAIVNELVKAFVGEEHRQAQVRAKAELHYFDEKLATAKTKLEQVETQIRELAQANPWLSDDLAALARDLERARERETDLQRLLAERDASLTQLRKNLNELQADDPATKTQREDLQKRIAEAEQARTKLEADRTAESKRSAELQTRVRQAPELLAQRRALDDARAQAADAVADYARQRRASEQDVERLASEAQPARFKVVEYARVPGSEP